MAASPMISFELKKLMERLLPARSLKAGKRCKNDEDCQRKGNEGDQG